MSVFDEPLQEASMVTVFIEDYRQLKSRAELADRYEKALKYIANARHAPECDHGSMAKEALQAETQAGERSEQGMGK